MIKNFNLMKNNCPHSQLNKYRIQIKYNYLPFQSVTLCEQKFLFMYAYFIWIALFPKYNLQKRLKGKWVFPSGLFFNNSLMRKLKYTLLKISAIFLTNKICICQQYAFWFFFFFFFFRSSNFKMISPLWRRWSRTRWQWTLCISRTAESCLCRVAWRSILDIFEFFLVLSECL